MIRKPFFRVYSLTSATLIGKALLLLVFSACSITQSPPSVTDLPPTSSVISLTTTSASNIPAVSATSTKPAPQSEVTITPELPVDPLTGWKLYKNNSVGISFQFPSHWYGPDIYVWGHGMRLAVGSDKVYPYGTDRLDQIYDVKNSYYAVIQYTKNSNNLTLEQYRENQPWINTYLSLLELKDGDSISGIRDLAIRIRKLKLGRFEGLEYISTLSDTAQTEYFYTRQVVLFDEHLNILNITGTPNNVEIINKDKWREAYQNVDEANLEVFYKILGLITVE